MKTTELASLEPSRSGSQRPSTDRKSPDPSRHATPNALRVGLLTIIASLCCIASAFAESYTLTQINPPSSAVSSSVVSIDNFGEAVGNTSVKVGRSTVAGAPFVWSNGVAQSLPLPGTATSAQVNAISDSG
jgi:hypothetical protein